MRPVEAADVADDVPVGALQRALREAPVTVAILFGSHAAGATHSGSDVDIAIELDDVRPGDPGYNDLFFGLDVELTETLETDDVDLVDLHTLSPRIAETVFEEGVLLVGDRERIATLRTQLTPDEQRNRTPRERLDDAVARIDNHLERADPVRANDER